MRTRQASTVCFDVSAHYRYSQCQLQLCRGKTYGNIVGCWSGKRYATLLLSLQIFLKKLVDDVKVQIASLCRFFSQPLLLLLYWCNKVTGWAMVLWVRFPVRVKNLNLLDRCTPRVSVFVHVYFPDKHSKLRLSESEYRNMSSTLSATNK